MSWLCLVGLAATATAAATSPTATATAASARVAERPVAAAVAPTSGPPAASDAARVELGLGIGTASPSALGTGLLLGPSLTADWAYAAWRLGGRLYLGLGTENDLTWQVSHSELRATVRAGAVQTWGRGELGLGVSAGALVLLESRARHQADRLGEAGIDAERSASAAGPYAALDGRVRLMVLDGWAVALEGGPSLGWLSLGDETRWILGWSAGLGVSYRL